jgi:hypothetical protein
MLWFKSFEVSQFYFDIKMFFCDSGSFYPRRTPVLQDIDSMQVCGIQSGLEILQMVWGVVNPSFKRLVV